MRIKWDAPVPKITHDREEGRHCWTNLSGGRGNCDPSILHSCAFSVGCNPGGRLLTTPAPSVQPAACDLSQLTWPSWILSPEQGGDWLQVPHLCGSSVLARLFLCQPRDWLLLGPHTLASTWLQLAASWQLCRPLTALQQTPFCPSQPESILLVCNPRTRYNHYYTRVNDNPPRMQWLLGPMKKKHLTQSGNFLKGNTVRIT